MSRRWEKVMKGGHQWHARTLPGFTPGELTVIRVIGRGLLATFEPGAAQRFAELLDLLLKTSSAGTSICAPGPPSS